MIKTEGRPRPGRPTTNTNSTSAIVPLRTDEPEHRAGAGCRPSSRAAEAGAAPSRCTTTVPVRYDRRRYRQARWVRREFDALLGLELEPVVLVDRGDYYLDCGMHLGVPERDRVGREMALAGWCP